MFKRTATIAIAVISLLSILPGTSGEQQAQLPLAIVDVDQDVFDMDVSPQGNRTATVTGRVYLTYPNNPLVDYADIYIEPDIPNFASLLLSDYKFKLSASVPEARFTGNLTVEPALSSSLTGTVRIDGSAVAYPAGKSASVQEDTFGVRILPYYGAQLYFKQVFGKIESGEKRSFVLQLNNTGNANDVFTLALMDASVLSSQGISVDFERTHSVPEGGSAEVEVTVKTHGADRGSYIIRVQASSKGNGDDQPEDSVGMLTITVEEKVISFLQGSPYGLIAVITIFLLALAGISVMTSMVLKRRRWKRQFQRMVDTTALENRTLNPPPPRTPPPGPP